MEKERMVQEIIAALEKLYWEDFVFMHQFVTGFAEKKHK